ncbi:3-phytase [Flavobacterium sp. 9AF]|uniref:phytase n=1 Tax=Flavobacterium sp. 9AF TaxID=2653142 RepID=UPI0012F258FD|nr:phytase [Flavobacterium sp. 9AF]VXA98311.1 3-phytase [Flavobacterium sp. 9AF]
MKSIFYSILLLAVCSCQQKSVVLTLPPDVITENTINDTDDPAIWVNPKDASQSIIFGTDKETNGAIYAFDLQGKIIESKTIRNIERPNNIDLTYNFKLNDSTKVDIIAFTEREKNQVRVFSVPDMQPLDNGGFKVFADATQPDFQAPMGIAIYHAPVSDKVYLIVGRKTGPKEDYLYQYELVSTSSGVTLNLVRKFGKFSGKKEIEAIAVDNEMGFIYYSDEQHGVRKYYAEPEKGNAEISLFGTTDFESDIEGIAIAKTGVESGYIIVSDQQRGLFNVYDRKTNAFITAVNLTTLETDGCDVVTNTLGTVFPKGIFVAMNDAKNFYVYDFGKLEKVILKSIQNK